MLTACYLSDLQDIRNKFCNEEWSSLFENNCIGRLLARYDKSRTSTTRQWRCYYNEALTRDRKRYDLTKKSACYYTRNAKLELTSFWDDGTF